MKEASVFGTRDAVIGVRSPLMMLAGGVGVAPAFGFGEEKVTERLLLVTELPLASVKLAERVAVSAALEVLVSIRVSVTESCPAGITTVIGPLANDVVVAPVQSRYEPEPEQLSCNVLPAKA